MDKRSSSLPDTTAEPERCALCQAERPGHVPECPLGESSAVPDPEPVPPPEPLHNVRTVLSCNPGHLRRGLVRHGVSLQVIAEGLGNSLAKYLEACGARGLFVLRADLSMENDQEPTFSAPSGPLERKPE